MLEDSPLIDKHETDYFIYRINIVFFLRGEAHGTA